MSQLYKQHIIYKIVKDEVWIYFCLENTSSSMFCVHQVEIVSRSRLSGGFDLLNSALDLLLEMSPDQRCEWHSSITGAILSHDADFENEIL